MFRFNSAADLALQATSVADEEDRAPELDELVALEFGQQARDGFARSPEELSDLFVGQEHPHPDPLLRLLTGPITPFEQKPGQTLSHRVGEAQ